MAEGETNFSPDNEASLEARRARGPDWDILRAFTFRLMFMKDLSHVSR